MQLTQKKRQRTDLLTVAAVAALFVVMAALLYTGHLTRQVTNMLVPVAVYIVMAVSLNLVVGLLGELSLGHAGFMSVGLFSGCLVAIALHTTALPLGVRLPVSMLAGGLVAAVFGLLVGLPALRLRGDYLAIVTLACGEIIKNIITNLNITGGALGLDTSSIYAGAKDLLPYGAVLVLLSPHVLRQRNGAFPLIATGLALLPGAIIGVWQGSAATLLFGIGTILLGTLSAPVMRRAIESIRGGRSFETLESRLSVGYLLLMLLCGGARMMLPYVNLGVTAAGLMTMAAAVYLGVCPGCVMGLMAGVTLALQGLPLSVTVALSLGGFLAGMGQMTGRRMVPCVLFALGTGGMLAYTGTIAWGALGAAAAAPLIMGVLPREADEFLRQQTRRFHPLPDAPGRAGRKRCVTCCGTTNGWIANRR